MPILKIAASKAAPVSTLRYNIDPERMIAMGSQLVIPGVPKKMSDQIMTTMRLFGKGRSPDERKYYAVEIYFDPVDLQQNGGTLDAERTDAYASEFAEETWSKTLFCILMTLLYVVFCRHG